MKTLFWFCKNGWVVVAFQCLMSFALKHSITLFVHHLSFFPQNDFFSEYKCYIYFLIYNTSVWCHLWCNEMMSWSNATAEKVMSLGRNWHRPCLRCMRCKKTLTPGGHAEVLSNQHYKRPKLILIACISLFPPFKCQTII